MYGYWNLILGVGMTYQEERQVRLRRQRSRNAIDLAMQGQWQEAVTANKLILEDFPGDVEALNRLGRAFIELGEYTRAREAYRQATEIDPYNSIAQKNLQRLQHLGEEAAPLKGETRRVEPHHFIEEIGKAGVINLFHLAPKEVRARMVAGAEVSLQTDGSGLNVTNAYGEYLGQVEPAHAPRLIRLMDGGNRYSASVVSSTEDSMTVMTREIYQDPGMVGRLSFPPRGAEELRPHVDERVFKMESELEEGLPEESGYTIIGGKEIEVLPDESSDDSEDAVSEEE